MVQIENCTQEFFAAAKCCWKIEFHGRRYCQVLSDESWRRAEFLVKLFILFQVQSIVHHRQENFPLTFVTPFNIIFDNLIRLVLAWQITRRWKIYNKVCTKKGSSLYKNIVLFCHLFQFHIDHQNKFWTKNVKPQVILWPLNKYAISVFPDFKLF